MKTMKLVRRAFVPVVVAGMMLLAASCTNPVLAALTQMTSKSFGLEGTWGNPAYSASNYLPACYQLVLRSDGTYACRSGSTPGDTGTYTIISVSISGDVRTYTLRALGAYTYYLLARVTGGTKLEIQSSYSAYPSAINSSDTMNYGTYTAQ